MEAVQEYYQHRKEIWGRLERWKKTMADSRRRAKAVERYRLEHQTLESNEQISLLKEEERWKDEEMEAGIYVKVYEIQLEELDDVHREWCLQYIAEKEKTKS